jgi:hypothetical protein
MIFYIIMQQLADHIYNDEAHECSNMYIFLILWNSRVY